MATKKWIVLPGGRVKRWKKSRCEDRPGGWTSGYWPCPPHWYRNSLNRKERRAARRSIRRGEETARFHVHPRVAPWYW